MSEDYYSEWLELMENPLEDPRYLAYRAEHKEHDTPQLFKQQEFCASLGNDYLAWYGAMSDHAKELEIENRWLKDQIYFKK